MNNTLARWNCLSAGEAENEILACCGSRTWARALTSRRPFTGEAMLLAAADDIWRNLTVSGWMEAFDSHPRIGESPAMEVKGNKSPGARSAGWSADEQSRAASASEDTKAALRDANCEYEKRFGRTFIVCATGKTAAEILEILRRRLANDPATELQEASAEQLEITRTRLRRWLVE
ncbi:MAG: 2-oxo-4-hydroxy-4-carboxy-5-ureidoimidazoline decarboxylase [Acidobacteria bacterium]|nr:2-oxo-4-hydroxy-4-carboxy-5-ureidoimidazoline decarboxylase [Acidobacteriota bacterium]MBV9624402.1 2-oxo-4-hydroxy-4-carboxy-5-ureidoimidazoline decarboxylase [Acidobacteriota bacterium]